MKAVRQVGTAVRDSLRSSGGIVVCVAHALPDIVSVDGGHTGIVVAGRRTMTRRRGCRSLHGEDGRERESDQETQGNRRHGGNSSTAARCAASNASGKWVARIS